MFTVFIKTELGEDGLGMVDTKQVSDAEEHYQLGAGAIVGLAQGQEVQIADPKRSTFMSPDPNAVRFRLYAPQMSIIWPGLDLIVKESSLYRNSKSRRFCYPFRLYPPPPGFDRGEYGSSFMKDIIELWRRLTPKAKTGGRVHMDAVEIRTAILAIRVN